MNFNFTLFFLLKTYLYHMGRSDRRFLCLMDIFHWLPRFSSFTINDFYSKSFVVFIVNIVTLCDFNSFFVFHFCNLVACIVVVIYFCILFLSTYFNVQEFEIFFVSTWAKHKKKLKEKLYKIKQNYENSMQCSRMNVSVSVVVKTQIHRYKQIQLQTYIHLNTNTQKKNTLSSKNN